MSQLGNPSPESSRTAVSDGSAWERPSYSELCLWCHSRFAPRNPKAMYCSKRCRQTAFRLRRKLVYQEWCGSPKRIAYADPPYPGMAKKYYGNEATFAGEVDHVDLVRQLNGSFDGWAISTSPKTLGEVLKLCGDDGHVCAWVKPIGVSRKAAGLVTTWEPLIVKPARKVRPGVRDWVSAQPARGGGDLIGRKPVAFCAFLFAALGASPADSFSDLFPGTGIVLKAWKELERTVSTEK